MNKPEPAKLAKEDGRYFTVGMTPDGGGVMALVTGERVASQDVHFQLPSAPALLLHLAVKEHEKACRMSPISLFDDHPQSGKWPENPARLFDLFEHLMAHVIFSFTALEAFTNEAIPTGFKYSFKSSRKAVPEEIGKADIERRVPIDEKLHVILPSIAGCESPKGTQIWERYRKLKELRDRIVHLKEADRTAHGPEETTIWGDLMRAHDVPFASHVVALMGHYGQIAHGRRWFRKFPYGTHSSE